MIISPYLKFRFLVGWHLEYNSLIFFLKRQCDLLLFGERLMKSPAYAIIFSTNTTLNIYIILVYIVPYIIIG